MSDASISLTVNGAWHRVEAHPDLPLLWVLRDLLGLKGTKYGCGVGVCGICTVLVDGKATRACVVPAADVEGRDVVTIEGLAQASHPLVAAWIAEQVPQCGYCQPGQLCTAAALLHENPNPSQIQIDDAMSGVLCRCGTYQRVRRAIRRAVLHPESHPANAGARPAARTECEPLQGASQAAATTESRALLDAHGRFAPNQWVRIGRDGVVTVIIDRSEMGQGVTTGLSMLVAEELEVDLEQIRTQFAPVDPAYANLRFGEQTTGGSTSIRAAWQALRQAGAAPREMLIAAAASIWSAGPEACRAEHGFVIHRATRRRLSYGELVEDAAHRPVPQEVRLKPPGEWRLLGRSIPRIEIPDMVVGRTRYGLDSAPPGALVAVVARCPVFGGTLERFDPQAALALPGVKHVIEIDAGVAVVAQSFWAACRGRAALQLTWVDGPNAALDNAAIRSHLARASRHRGKIVRDEGDAESAWAAAENVIEAVYETPYLAHATLEPMNCTAHVREGRCDVWAGTQAQQGARDAASRESGLAKEAVHIHTVNLGGGFGRRLEQDVVIEAVQLSKALCVPVQVVWTRDDDLQHDCYRPAHLVLMKAALRRGQPLAWWQRVVGPDLALDGINLHYSVAHIREEHVRSDPGVPTGAWRSVGASQNAFAIECFVDELAYAAGKDPLQFRLELLDGSPRHRAALELAARKAGWGMPLQSGRGRGIAVYRAFGSWVAEVAEVSASDDGELRVHRVVCAIDCGLIINPDAAIAQVEGGIAFGLSAALHEEVAIERGRVTQRNFEEYPLLTMREMPEVEVHIVPSDEDPGGVGEPGVPPIAPAVANAVFAATGRRLRRLPLRLSDGAR